MSSELKTKYASVYVSTDDADIEVKYFGYIAVNFNITDLTASFFADSYDLQLLKDIREFFQRKPSYNVEKMIRLEDASILIDLARVADKVYAPDMLGLVKKLEEEFDSKAGL